MKTEKNEKFWMFKAPVPLKLALNRIRIERIKTGKDDELRTYKRIGLAIARSEKLFNELVNADFIEDDK
jgi:hypothetical protein